MKKTLGTQYLEPTTINQTGLDLIFHRMAKSNRNKWEKYNPVKQKDCVDTFESGWSGIGDDCGKVDWD